MYMTYLIEVHGSNSGIKNQEIHKLKIETHADSLKYWTVHSPTCNLNDT